MGSAPVYPYPGGVAGDEPPDPTAGAPGHFAWSRWIKQFVKNLDTQKVAKSGEDDVTITGPEKFLRFNRPGPPAGNNSAGLNWMRDGTVEARALVNNGGLSVGTNDAGLSCSIGPDGWPGNGSPVNQGYIAANAKDIILQADTVRLRASGMLIPVPTARDHIVPKQCFQSFVAAPAPSAGGTIVKFPEAFDPRGADPVVVVTMSQPAGSTVSSTFLTVVRPEAADHRRFEGFVVQFFSPTNNVEVTSGGATLINVIAIAL